MPSRMGPPTTPPPGPKARVWPAVAAWRPRCYAGAGTQAPPLQTKPTAHWELLEHVVPHTFPLQTYGEHEKVCDWQVPVPSQACVVSVLPEQVCGAHAVPACVFT